MKQKVWDRVEWQKIGEGIMIGLKAIRSFLQTPLGSALAGASVASYTTYMFSYTSLSQERDQAIESLGRVNDLNDALVKANTQLTIATQNLLATNNLLTKKHLSYKQKFNRCVSDVELIKSLHTNSYFKPNISHIGNNYTKDYASKRIAEEEYSEENGTIHNRAM